MGEVIYLKNGGDNMSNSIFQIAKAFLNIESMSNKKLQKLCYYAQAWYLVLAGEKMFDNKFEAWIHGPVCPSLYHEYKNYGWNDIPREDEVPNDIPDEKLDFIWEVYETYGDFSGDELEMLTHEERPWVEARGNLDPLKPSHNIISEQTMKEFYSNVLEESQE